MSLVPLREELPKLQSRFHQYLMNRQSSLLRNLRLRSAVENPKNHNQTQQRMQAWQTMKCFQQRTIEDLWLRSRVTFRAQKLEAPTRKHRLCPHCHPPKQNQKLSQNRRQRQQRTQHQPKLLLWKRVRPNTPLSIHLPRLVVLERRYFIGSAC